MDPTMLRALLNNVALLFLLSVVFDAIYTLPYKYRRIQTVYSGLMISLICITILLMNIPLGSGIFYDTRSVLISSAALAFGLVPTLITAASAAILQLIMGGGGVLFGLATIILSALIGLAWRRLILRKPIFNRLNRWLSVFCMSIVIHALIPVLMLLLPSPNNITTIRAMAAPVLLIQPPASVLLCMLFMRRQDYKNTQAQLGVSEEKYRRLYETMAQGVVYQSSDGSIISANPAAERILGQAFSDLRVKTSMNPDWESISEDSSQMAGSEHPAMIALRTGKACGPTVMGIYQSHLDDHVWLSVNAIPLFRPGESKPYEVYTTFEDITAERKADRAYQQLFREMVDAFSLHEIIPDEQGKPKDYRFLTVNPAFEQMTGLKSADIIGKSVLEVIPQTQPHCLISCHCPLSWLISTELS